LISVAAGLTRPGDIVVGDGDQGGGIKINGERGTLPKQLIGVVWQDDLLLSNLTVRENLYFCARLKTNQDDAAVRQLVQETLDELGIAHIADRVVGGGNGGGPSISGGERKRVAVGSELVVRPSLLFCDEPTSGLDATTAQSLILTLRQLCMEKGHSIVVVIHQPRAAIYALFDHLLLLSRGNVLYDGPACRVRSYLETVCGESLPPETGLADWLMDVVTKDERQSSSSSSVTTSSSVLASKWKEARKTFLLTTTTNDDEHCSTTKRSTNHPSELRLSTLQELKAGPKYHTSSWTQFRLLTLRTLKQQRGERLTMTAVVLQVVYLFFTALFWWRLPDRTDRIFERNSLLFFMLIAQSNSTVIVAVNVFQRERILLSRERAKKMYTVSSYFLAKTVSDMSNNVLLPLLYTSAVYWTGNFRPTAAAFFQNVFAFYWTFSTAQSMGLFLSIFISSPQIALILAPSITLFFMILGGFYIPLDNLHAGVRWASYLSFARYAYSSLAYVYSSTGVCVQAHFACLWFAVWSRLTHTWLSLSRSGLPNTRIVTFPARTTLPLVDH
jgi:ABC-type multidrug transport system ATPase subunit